jgi:hypothetical protein
MIDILMGAAKGLLGHLATHELLPGTIDAGRLGCKARVTRAREVT